MTPDKCDLPWTEGGKELLCKIKRIIDHNGGNYSMAKGIEKEAPEFFGKAPVKRVCVRSWYTTKVKWTDDQNKFIEDNWDKMTLMSMSFVLKRDQRKICAQGKKLGLPPKKRNIYNNQTTKKHEKETRNSQAQTDKANSRRAQNYTSHHANL